MVFTISIVGLHESGKTTIIEDLIQQLGSKLSVGSIKHSQKPVEVDKEGSDSWRHRKAGTSITCLSSQAQFILFQKTEQDLPLKKIIYLMERANPKLDLVLIEGYKKERIPKIVITKSKDFLKEFHDEEIWAVLNDDEFDSGYPQFARDDIEGLQKLILERFEQSVQRYSSHERMKVTLVINDVQVPFNRFVADVLGNTVYGMTLTLKGIDTIEKVLIRVKYSQFELISRRSSPDVDLKLIVNDKEIQIREFVRKVYANVLTSLLSTIKTEAQPKTVELSIEWIGT